jgi:predicted ABC-type ATPase
MTDLTEAGLEKMLKEIRQHSRSGANFAFETTLSGRTYSRMIPEWQTEGYHVKLFFLTLPSAEMAIARVAERVRQGGHNVPEEVIRRRFSAGLNNFDKLYRNLVDSWAVYCSSGDEQQLVEWSENDEQ